MGVLEKKSVRSDMQNTWSLELQQRSFCCLRSGEHMRFGKKRLNSSRFKFGPLQRRKVDIRILTAADAPRCRLFFCSWHAVHFTGLRLAKIGIGHYSDFGFAGTRCLHMKQITPGA